MIYGIYSIRTNSLSLLQSIIFTKSLDGLFYQQARKPGVTLSIQHVLATFPVTLITKAKEKLVTRTRNTLLDPQFSLGGRE